MATSTVVKITCLLVGVVIGGGVVYGVIRLTGSKENSISDAEGTRVNASLQYVIVVSRHGNRGGTLDYPDDPYPINNTGYWPYGPDALTPVGRKQEYHLGKKLRSLYNGFIPKTFHSNDIYACSDLYERVVMSGDLVLAGLYPPQGWQLWDKNINWQPIALYTNSSDHSKNIDDCPRYAVEKAKAKAIFLKDDATNITYLTSYFYEKSRINYTDDDLAYMFEKVISEDTEGYSLSEWMMTVYPERLTDFYKKQFIASVAGTDEVSRLWVGNMLGEIINTLKSKIIGTSLTKMSYYSGHDVTIVNLQIALGISRSDIVTLVTPGSALVIELYNTSVPGEYTLQALFINGSLSDLEPVKLHLETSCGDPCTFASLVNITQRFTNISFDEECQTT